jgi:NADH-quinone oxidoreductase subunit H
MEFDPIVGISEWFHGLLDGWGVAAGMQSVISALIGAAVVGSLVMIIFIALTWIERKVAARFQDRIGPNRVGPYGLLQPIADAVKMITKEDTTPDNADKVAFNIAPILSVVSVLLMWAVIPFAGQEKWVGTSLNVGVLYIAAVGSFGVISVLMAGWSSNNKYALMGAFRGVAQLISYEIPLFLSLLIPVLLSRSMDIKTIVEAQEGMWFVFVAPLAFVIYFISSLAEIGRTPFDLLEAESEIVAGYHVEYSGMKFGLFQAGEFLHSFTASAIFAILFFGGWQSPFGLFGAGPLAGVFWFFVKTFGFYFIIAWTRNTLPRVRIDAMMDLNWKFMVPVSLVLLMVTPLIDRLSFLNGIDKTLPMLIANLLIMFVAMDIVRKNVKKNEVERVPFPERPLAVPPVIETEEAAA